MTTTEVCWTISSVFIAVMLLPARTDTRWWHRYILNRAEVRFLPGRLRFEIDGKPGGPAPFRPRSWSCGRERDNN